jgi:hypothetical protein
MSDWVETSEAESQIQLLKEIADIIAEILDQVPKQFFLMESVRPFPAFYRLYVT